MNPSHEWRLEETSGDPPRDTPLITDQSYTKHNPPPQPYSIHAADNL